MRTSIVALFFLTSSVAAAATLATSTNYAARSSSSNTSGVAALLGSHNGRATFYGGNWSGGKCLFADYPQGSFKGTAIGSSQWYGSASCGACLRVTGPNGTADVMVVDQCPECEAGHLDLFQDVANTVDRNAATDGNFAITWQEIPCAVTGNLQFKNKEGTSAYYFALQVRNSVQPIDTLEVSTNSGASWTAVQRLDYNYFTSYSGFGNTVDVRVTSSTGEVIIQTNVQVSSGTIVQGTSQFKN